jgi:hypothetical protein
MRVKHKGLRKHFNREICFILYSYVLSKKDIVSVNLLLSAMDCYLLCFPSEEPVLPAEGRLNDPPLEGALNDLPPEGAPNVLPPEGDLNVLPPEGAVNDLPLEGALNVLPPDGALNDLPPEGVLNVLLPEGGLILFRLKIDVDPFLTPEERKRPVL